MTEAKDEIDSELIVCGPQNTARLTVFLSLLIPSPPPFYKVCLKPHVGNVNSWLERISWAWGGGQQQGGEKEEEYRGLFGSMWLSQPARPSRSCDLERLHNKSGTHAVLGGEWDLLALAWQWGPGGLCQTLFSPPMILRCRRWTKGQLWARRPVHSSPAQAPDSFSP